MDFFERREFIKQEFESRFGNQPMVITRAPGRVDLMGSHTDYNEGFVLTQAIDRDTWLAARPRPDREVRIASLNTPGSYSFGLDDIQRFPESSWVNYVCGVAKIFQDQDMSLVGFDGLLHSTVPFSSGLSSSAALEVAVAVMFDLLGNLKIDPVQMARLCQRAENEFVGMRCGILDQYSSLMGRAGHVLLLDCRTLQSATKPIQGDLQVVICDTCAERALSGTEYPERRAQCEQGARILADFYPEICTLRDANLNQLEEHYKDMPEIVFRRCRFIIEENQRVLDLASALSKADFNQVASLTALSYLGARDEFEIGCPEMDAMYNAMTRGPGVVGARQAGAGFGGCMVAFVHESAVSSFIDHVSCQYHAKTGIESQVFAVQAVEGAGRLEL